MRRAMVLLALMLTLVWAQDPAPSWLAWAAASCAGRITRLEATNVVPPVPRSKSAGQPSFWFGIEDRNNVNLIQPIVPAWNQCRDEGYCVFNEQFRWHGMQNWNGQQVQVRPGDLLNASVALATNGTYVMTISISGSVNYTIQELRPPSVLEGYNFTHAFFVVEHHERCSGLPPTPIIYQNIRLDCDYRRIGSPIWTTNIGASPICNAKAIVNSPSQVTLSWTNNDGR